MEGEINQEEKGKWYVFKCVANPMFIKNSRLTFGWERLFDTEQEAIDYIERTRK